MSDETGARRFGDGGELIEKHAVYIVEYHAVTAKPLLPGIGSGCHVE